MLTDEKIQIMLIGQPTMVRSALAVALECLGDLRICAQAATLVEVPAALENAEPNVILLVLMDERDLDTLARLCDTVCIDSIIVLLQADNPSLALRAKQSGVINVVHDDRPLESLIVAIKDVHIRREDLRTGAAERAIGAPATDLLPPKPLGNWPTAISNDNIDSAEKDSELQSRIARLTRRERDVIGSVVDGLTSAEILEHLAITTSTFRHHLTSIFKKLEVGNRVELTVFVYRNNIIDPKPTPRAYE